MKAPTRERAEEVVVLAERLGFPFFLEVGKGLRGWARVEPGEGEAGIAEIQQALVELAGIGSGIGAPAPSSPRSTPGSPKTSTPAI